MTCLWIVITTLFYILQCFSYITAQGITPGTIATDVPWKAGQAYFKTLMLSYMVVPLTLLEIIQMFKVQSHFGFGIHKTVLGMMLKLYQTMWLSVLKSFFKLLTYLVLDKF
ncbi:uncharacterized protein BX664DRAFT_170631 [Halteromyces radiatus]|uniref:uncharacterized protein n=1 Tax=Halteromyces radiatus TaxID=101107 RepID=UPI00221EEFE5|nr:uncharacterized protein BX664DRAFT_170631 [Halteromyces radiatus]KAI8084674.1 hypothetical protein BX664DRAFT_170631 [Halteromyces radiatus]